MQVGIGVRKRDDFAQWYTQCLLKSEMMDYSETSGCYILRPWSFKIWQKIQQFIGGEIERLGVQDAYFPLLIPEAALRQETEHLQGFAPEVAWVTHAGDAPLAARLAIRPTSETAIYPAYARWIRTRRDLPLRMNQWCSVVRWEFKHPQPFLRSREFLWQEGHSAFAGREEAEREVRDILELYRRTYEEVLAVPVTAGLKSEQEKFAGAEYTATVEAFVPETGRAVQAATSHALGQNFARIFGVRYEEPDGAAHHVWQTSWGFTTRAIGLMVMAHGDDDGLVLPPRVAATQVVVVPVGLRVKNSIPAAANEQIASECRAVVEHLVQSGIRAQADLSENHTPGWKFSQWELKGVPIRLEIGPQEVAGGFVTAAVRHDRSRVRMDRAELAASIARSFDAIHAAMLRKATAAHRGSIVAVDDWASFSGALAAGKMALAPWCARPDCETAVRARSSAIVDGQTVAGAKSLCTPFEQPQPAALGRACYACGAPARAWTLFGRSY